MVRIPLDKVWMIVAMAREALGPEPPDRDDGLAPGTDGDEEGTAFDPLFDYVDSLNGDELADLLALVWVGRGAFAAVEWPDAVADAEVELEDGDAVAELIRDPQLPDDLCAGLEAMGYDTPEE